MKPRPNNEKSRAGFTLLELMISAAVGAMILTAAAACLSASVSSQKMIEPRVDALQSARVALALMTADLRAACPLDSDYPFLGTPRTAGDIEADNIDFATHHYGPRRPREGDYCEMSYYLDKEPVSGQFGLWRRRNPVLAQDPLSGGEREEIARGMRGMKLEYYDGIDWYDTWGEINQRKRANSTIIPPNLIGMPQAVRITLSFDVTNEPPLIFQTVVFLELAQSSTQTQSNSSGTGSTNAAPAPPNGEAL